MTEPRNIPWKRIGVEAAAIVASILLAFAIDAWWDSKVDQSRSEAQLRSLAIEFGEVDLHLQTYEGQLLSLRQAVAEFLSHVGPQTDLQSMDTLNSLIDLGFRASTMELPAASQQALLVTGDLSAVSDDKLSALLATWPAQVSNLRNQSRLLEANREEIIRYLHDKVPTLRIAHKTNQMGHYPESDFAGDPEILQRDMKVEGLFGNRGMLIEDTLDIVSELQVHARDTANLIETELGN